MYNITTLGMGLGFSSNRLLAWGLGSWFEIVIEIPSFGYFRPVEGEEKPERVIIIRIRFGKIYIEKKYKIADKLIKIFAWFIGIKRSKRIKRPIVEAKLWSQ